MRWVLTLTIWWMNFATRLSHLMLRCGEAAFKDDSLAQGVRVVSKFGSIVRTSPGGILSPWHPLVLPLMNMAKPSTTWFLLHNTRRTWASPGFLGAESGEENLMQCTLNFQEHPHVNERCLRNLETCTTRQPSSILPCVGT